MGKAKNYDEEEKEYIMFKFQQLIWKKSLLEDQDISYN